MLKNLAYIFILIFVVACTSSKAIPTRDHLRAVVPVTDGHGGGTAFFINDRQLVSAAHVCGNNDALYNMVLGDKYRVLATDVARDLCLLESDYKYGPRLPIAKERPGFEAELTVIGFPFLMGRSVTRGWKISTPNIYRFDMVSAQVSPGNSGGPVLNKQGEVVGVLIVGHILTGFGGYTVLSDLKEFLHAAEAGN
jgi:S1-C subfamily serine protease